MQKYLLLDDNGQGVCILDEVIASSEESAIAHFDNNGWIVGEVMTEVDFITTGKNEADLNGLESQTFE